MTSAGPVARPQAIRGPSRLTRVFAKAFSLRHVRADMVSLYRPAAGNLPGLDIARAVAVLIVICDHFRYDWLEFGLPPLSLFKLPMFHFGWTGVDLFFVLSGCLIGQQLWKEHVRTGRVRVMRFVAKRGFRIWPLYFTTLAILLILGDRFVPIWADWLLVSNFFSGRGYVRGWSLSTEEHFYILTPIIFLLAGRFRSPRFVATIFASGLIVVPLLRLWMSQRLRAQGMAELVISDRMYAPFHLHSESLFLGVVLAFLFTCVTPSRPVLVRWVQVALLAGAAAGLMLRAMDKISFAYVAMAFLYGSLVWFLWNSRRVAVVVGRVRLFHVVARLSFGMYLNHLVLRDEVPRAHMVAAAVTDSSLAQAVLALMIVIAQSALLATITYVLVEQPWLRVRAAQLDAAQLPMHRV